MPSDEPAALTERFHRYLRDRRLPVTRQRDLVAETVFRAADHPSVEGIERNLRAAGAEVGTATVYRTLELLEAAGLVRSHDFGEGYRRYEPVTGDSDHEHLVCLRCGRVIEFANERLERMLPVIADEQGFQHAYHRVEIYGTCQDCRRRDVGTLGR